MNQVCVECQIDKPLDSFPKRCGKNDYRNLGRKLSTHDSRCNACKAAYAKEFRKRNPGYRGTGRVKAIPQEDRLLMSAISHRLVCAKKRAEKYKQPTPDINREHLYDLFKKQDGKCALSGVPLKIEKRAVTCLSLDQKEAGLGYVMGNVQWVAWAVNRAKGDMPQDMFVDMCQQILEYQKVQRLSP